MDERPDIDRGQGIDWAEWVARWDRMQERYISQRQERFSLMVALVGQTQANVSTVLDLGCGTGSLMLAVLERLPNARIVGIDHDPTLLPLARQRLAHFSGRVQILEVDLRKPGWVDQLPQPPDAVVSATALHWLSPAQLAALYQDLGRCIRPGGIFLNADHVASGHKAIQQAWEQARNEKQETDTVASGESWDAFWEAYGRVLGTEAIQRRREAVGDWKGVEEGMPLRWHFDQLRASGFTTVDCFWRSGGDAIYGGIRI